MLKGRQDLVDALTGRRPGVRLGLVLAVVFGTCAFVQVLAGLPPLALFGLLLGLAARDPVPALAGVARVRQDPPAAPPVRARARPMLSLRPVPRPRPAEDLVAAPLTSVVVVETSEGAEFRSRRWTMPTASESGALGLVGGFGVGLGVGLTSLALYGALDLAAGVAGTAALIGVGAWGQAQLWRRRSTVRIDRARGLLRAELRSLPLAEIRVVEAAPRGAVRIATSTRELVIPGGFVAADEVAAFADLLRAHVRRAQSAGDPR